MDRVSLLIFGHLERYPDSEVDDVYKLLHQGAFGPGHAITNRKAAMEWLEADWADLDEMAGSVMVESVHPAGEVVRLHLRPYRDAGGDPVMLLDAFIASSREYSGDASLMATWWAKFEDMVLGPLADRFDAKVVRLTGMVRADKNWPAVHHSPAYESAYRPSYRVLTRARVEGLLASQGIDRESEW